MLLSAACSVLHPRALYRAGKVAEAVEYLQTVRLGQTERGSFVITRQSPVAPALKRPPLSTPMQDEDEPFSRKVTQKLAQSWQALQAAVTEVATSDDFSAFEQRIALGVNANLCEAVALLARHSRGIELGLAWARVRPANQPDVRQFFTADASRILEEAAREFRRNQPRLDMPLEGFVVNQGRAPEEFNGTATQRLTIDGKPKRVKATFDPAAYDLVIRAFQDKTMLALDGDLYPLGQRLELRNPRYVTLVDDVDATGSQA